MTVFEINRFGLAPEYLKQACQQRSTAHLFDTGPKNVKKSKGMFSCFEEDSDDEVHYYREAEDDFKDLNLDQEL